MSVAGVSFLMAATAASPFEGVLAARYILEGLWGASWRIASYPRPVLPVRYDKLLYLACNGAMGCLTYLQ